MYEHAPGRQPVGRGTQQVAAPGAAPAGRLTREPGRMAVWIGKTCSLRKPGDSLAGDRGTRGAPAGRAATRREKTTRRVAPAPSFLAAALP